MRNPSKVFYGWIVIFASVVLTALGMGMFTSTNSVLVKPICDTFGFARGQFTLYRTVITLTGALVMPLYGRAIQRMGAKKVMMAGALMVGLVSIGYSFATELWHFYALAFVNGLFVNGISFMSIGVLVSAWFDGKKGLATGLAYAGSGLGGAVMVPVVTWVIEAAGWQWAYRFMGVLGIAILLPVIALLVRNTPEEMGLAPFPPDKPREGTAHARAKSLTLREAFRTGKLWLLIVAFFLINFFAGGTNTHTAPYLSDLGYSAGYVSAVFSVFMIFLTVGKIILGTLYDRYGTLAGGLVVCFFCLAFPVFALLARVPAMAWAYAVSIGMASCAVSVPISILVVRYFGEKDFPTIFSFFSMVSTLSPSISVPAMGAVFDATGSYRVAWIAFLFLSVIIAICLLWAEAIDRREKRKALAKESAGEGLSV